jgi:hypothetical protein
MKFEKRRNSMATPFMAIFLALMILLTITIVVSIPPVMAQNPPIGLFGNPHDFRPGPPIPSCHADFHQGPPDDPRKGCRGTP